MSFTVQEFSSPDSLPTTSGSLSYDAVLLRLGAGGRLRRADDKVPNVPPNAVGALTLRGTVDGDILAGAWLLTTDAAGVLTASVQIDNGYVFDPATLGITHPDGAVTLCFGVMNWLAITNLAAFANEVARPGA